MQVRQIFYAYRDNCISYAYINIECLYIYIRAK